MLFKFSLKKTEFPFIKVKKMSNIGENTKEYIILQNEGDCTEEEHFI